MPPSSTVPTCLGHGHWFDGGPDLILSKTGLIEEALTAMMRTPRRLNSKLHAACDGQGRPVVMLLTEGQAKDHRGTALMLHRLPPARELIGDRGYDSASFRQALRERGTAA